MKRHVAGGGVKNHPPAAFRRLCVETEILVYGLCTEGPAAFRRLCVETLFGRIAA